MWGPKYTHFVDVWVAYRDLQNKFGLDHKVSSICDIAPGSATTLHRHRLLRYHREILIS